MDGGTLNLMARYDRDAEGDAMEDIEGVVQRQPSLPGCDVDLETLINAEEQRFKELTFIKGYTGLDKRPVYVVMQLKLLDYPPFRYTSCINIT